MSQPMSMPVVLSIAGFDPSSGAGVTADLKTIAAHGCYGIACITALTVQSTCGVKAVHPVEAELVSATLEELWDDLPPQAVRVGMLGSSSVGRAVAAFLRAKRAQNIVLDPILSSTSGTDLAGSGTLDVLRQELLPLATVITPNLAEAIALTDLESAQADAAEATVLARRLQEIGACNVMITGGDSPVNRDLLLTQEGKEYRFEGEQVRSRSTHGTGCAFATALACGLALGRSLPEAVKDSKAYVFRAIQSAPGLGHGLGPLDHLWPLKQS